MRFNKEFALGAFHLATVLAGVALTTYGAQMIYAPAAYILPGAFLVYVGWPR